MRIFIKAMRGHFPSEFSEQKVTGIRPTTYTNGSLELDHSSQFFPKRSDEKVMREDIKSLVVVASSLIDDLQLNDNELEATSLFVANGAFVEDTERYMSGSINLYQSLPKESSLEDKLPHLYKVSPPLLALITLTNSSMSFVAQYTNIKGNNATYGTTSLSFFHAIQDAIRDLKLGRSKRALVCATNCGGNYSFLMNSSIMPYSKSWTEGAATGCLLLEASDTVPQNAIAEITQLKSETRIPSTEGIFTDSNWVDLIPESAFSGKVFLSGSYTNEMDQERLLYAESNNINTDSTFSLYGNLGPVNIYLGIQKGIEQFNVNCNSFVVIDKDVYGRESMICVANV